MRKQITADDLTDEEIADRATQYLLASIQTEVREHYLLNVDPGKSFLDRIVFEFGLARQHATQALVDEKNDE